MKPLAKIRGWVGKGYRKVVSILPFTNPGLREDNYKLAQLLGQATCERDGLLFALGELQAVYRATEDNFVTYLASFAMQNNGEARLSQGIIQAIRRGGGSVLINQEQDGTVVFTLTKPEEGGDEE